VRASAASALANLGDRRAVEPLIALLREDDLGHARGAAAWALGELGDARALPALRALEGDEAHPRKMAVEAMEKIKTRQSD